MELILESTESHTDYDDGRSLQRIIMKDKMIMIWFSWHDCLGAKDLGGEDASCFIWEMMTKHKRTEEGGSLGPRDESEKEVQTPLFFPLFLLTRHSVTSRLH